MCLSSSRGFLQLVAYLLASLMIQDSQKHNDLLQKIPLERATNEKIKGEIKPSNLIGQPKREPALRLLFFTSLLVT